MCLIVNLYGGPGTGKSTTASGVFSLLKLHGVSCELTAEFAKDLTWEERKVALQNQIYVLGKQYHRMFRLIGKVDVIITDSPLLLGLIYDQTKSDSFRKMVLELDGAFNNLNFFLKRVKPFDQKGRGHTEDESVQIDCVISDMMIDLNLTHEIILADHSGINEITRKILSEVNTGLDRAMRYKIARH